MQRTKDLKTDIVGLHAFEKEPIITGHRNCLMSARALAPQPAGVHAGHIARNLAAAAGALLRDVEGAPPYVQAPANAKEESRSITTSLKFDQIHVISSWMHLLAQCHSSCLLCISNATSARIDRSLRRDDKHQSDALK